MNPIRTFLFAWFCSVALSLSAQSDSLNLSLSFSSAFEPGPVLPPLELNRQKTYYSLSEALQSPEQVYKLSLSDNQLKTLPADIGRLRNLQVLNLSQNKLRTLPPEIAQLSNLQVLILNRNRLTTLPDTLKVLGNMEQMYVAYNRLDELPVWVGGLSHLRRLDITANQLTPYQIEKIRSRLPRCEVTHGQPEPRD